MQPYLFPYIGYYQLANISDIFVFYDDVNYIKNGYINRNYILISGQRKLFTVPTINASSFKKINEVGFSVNKKLVRMIEQSYSKARYFSKIMPLVENVLSYKCATISELSMKSVVDVFDYLDLEFKYCRSKDLGGSSYNRVDRLVYLCKSLSCDQYYNSIGGIELYSKDDFLNHGIELNFLKSDEISYDQSSASFMPNLSMIDVLMNNSKSQVISLLNKYTIL